MVGTPAQQRLAKKFFDPFFNWDDDGKLREWLRGQDPDELEQFLNWFNFGSHRDREILGRQELAKLRDRQRPGTPAQQSLVKKFFDPFFNWDDDGKLREWLRGQDPDELEQFLNWFNFSSRRDREILGRQELAKLRDRQRPAPEVLTLKPTYLGVGVDLKECWRRLRTWWMQAK